MFHVIYKKKSFISFDIHFMDMDALTRLPDAITLRIKLLLSINVI